MDGAKIKNVLRDEENNITYLIVAYRNLTRDEMIFAVRQLWSQKRKPKKNSTYTIMTVFGADGR